MLVLLKSDLVIVFEKSSKSNKETCVGLLYCLHLQEYLGKICKLNEIENTNKSY